MTSAAKVDPPPAPTPGPAPVDAPAAAADGESFEPYIRPERNIRELTIPGLVLGSVLGIVFAASSVYLGLKVGLTVSASIPIAVLSITILRYFGKTDEPRILVNNIVQTTGSAGESIAAGVAFTLPSLLLMGFDMELVRILLVSLLGGVLGVLMMIPLRQGLIVKEHGKLTYPEGTACAQVLIVGEQGGTNAKTVFQGFGWGMAHAVLMRVFHLWKDEPGYVLKAKHMANASIAGELSAPMLGVGYIIGYETAAVMMAGGVLSFVILVPLITHFGGALAEPFGPGVTAKISEMSPHEIRNAYLLYIGAGAVATGGFISLARSLPTIVHAFKRGLGSLGAKSAPKRTEQDMSMRVVVFGSIGLVLAIAAAPVLQINPVSAVLIVLFGFFFVTVSSRITGEIGSSSNPISGMTVATLLITCLLFVAVGWTGVGYKAMALTTAAIVCVAASNGGTISQDLKTGFLVGGTPHRQQKAILVGVITSAIVIGLTLIYLNKSAETIAPKQTVYAAYTVPAAELAKDGSQPYEGKTYKVHFIKEDVVLPAVAAAAPGEKAVPVGTPPTPGSTVVPRGRYLVDDGGKIAFVVDPGVCGVEKYRVKPPAADAPAYTALPPPAGEKDEKFHVDGKAFRVAVIESTGRTYLVDDETKQVGYEATLVSKFDAPKAHLFQLIIDGIIGGQLPWTLVLIGVAIALMMELVGVSALPFAVGLYLPISTSTPIFIGGIIRRIVDKRTKVEGTAAEFSPGTLLASGLIAGGSIGGLVEAIITGTLGSTAEKLGELGPKVLGSLAQTEWLPLIPFGIMGWILLKVGLTAKAEPDKVEKSAA